MSAFLIEARSIGGLSGSPVYANLGHTRVIKNKVQESGSDDKLTFILMGIIHGHYDEPPDDRTEQRGINMGIAIVTPIQAAICFIEETTKARLKIKKEGN